MTGYQETTEDIIQTRQTLLNDSIVSFIRILLVGESGSYIEVKNRGPIQALNNQTCRAE